MGGEEGAQKRATAVPPICSAFRLIRIGSQCTNEKLCRGCIKRQIQVFMHWRSGSHLSIDSARMDIQKWPLYIHKHINTAMCKSVFIARRLWEWTQSQGLKVPYVGSALAEEEQQRVKTDNARIKPHEIILKRSKPAMNAFQWHIMIDFVCRRNLFPTGLWPLDQPYFIHINIDSCAS